MLVFSEEITTKVNEKAIYFVFGLLPLVFALISKVAPLNTKFPMLNPAFGRGWMLISFILLMLLEKCATTAIPNMKSIHIIL